jgi:chitodextrinase
MNFTTPYNTSDYFFTKEQEPILFESPLQNTYFEMVVAITTFDFYTNLPRVKTLNYKIALFENKASFILGEIIDRAMPMMKGINLRSLFQYKAAQVQLTITEYDYESDIVLQETPVGPIKFVSGFTPEIVEGNCAFLDLYKLSRSVTPNGYAFINMILTTGTHDLKVYKNDIEVDAFSITVVSGNICSKGLNLTNYQAHQGDVIEVRVVGKTTLSKTFYVFPISFYSNYIAFEDEYRLKTVMEFTGDYKFNSDFVALYNKVQKGIVEFNKKVSSKTDLGFTINTGFLLKEEEIIIESLFGSLKAWLIIGENQGIEIIPTSKKMSKYDPQTALYSYDVEFMVNTENAKPLMIDLDSALVILEVDDIAPSAPGNLRKQSSTTTSVNLQWDESIDINGVTGYDVYKNSVYLTTVTTLVYTATGLTAGTSYNFYVIAKDAANNLSNSSNILSVTTPATVDNEAPTQPSGLAASEIGASDAKLSWIASTDNVGVVQYNIFKNGVKIGQTGNTLEYFVTGLSPQTTYNFYVNAADAAGNISAPSSTASATTTGLSVQSFYYEGFFEPDDPRAPYGGSVTYKDANGVTVTQEGFYVGTCTEIIANSIISTSRARTC